MARSSGGSISELPLVLQATIAARSNVERLRDEAMQFVAIFYRSNLTAKSHRLECQGL